MKQKLLLLLLPFGTFGFGQNYIPIPDSGATWVNTYSTVVTQPFLHCELVDATNYCVNGEDTIINSTLYTKLEYCGGGYKGALRDDNGKVYYVPTDSTTEYLMFDFTAQVDDTLLIYYELYANPGQLSEFVVSQIDSILIYGEYHNVFYSGGGGPFIEGIGNAFGLLSEPWENISGWCSELACMSLNDTTLWPSEGLGNCPLDLGTELIDLDFNFYPNPSADGIFNIQYNPTLDDLIYKVFSPNGQVLQEGVLNSDQINLGTDTGIYFIQVSNGKAMLTRRIIVQ